MNTNYKEVDEQEHSHMHAFGATLFMIVLVGLLALSYVWQSRATSAGVNEPILAASAISIIPPAEGSASLFQPEEGGTLLEGDSLNGFQSDYIGYVNQAYGLSFSMLRSLALESSVSQEAGLRIVIVSPVLEQSQISVRAFRQENAADDVSAIIGGSDIGASQQPEDVSTAQTESGFEAVQYSILESDGTRLTSALAGEEFRYDISLFTPEDNPKDDDLYEQYEYILDTLFIQ